MWQLVTFVEKRLLNKNYWKVRDYCDHTIKHSGAAHIIRFIDKHSKIF